MHASVNPQAAQLAMEFADSQPSEILVRDQSAESNSRGDSVGGPSQEQGQSQIQSPNSDVTVAD